MPWIRAVTAIRVGVARMIPRRVRRLRSLFLRSESSAIRVDSQNEALNRNLVRATLLRRGSLRHCSILRANFLKTKMRLGLMVFLASSVHFQTQGAETS